MWHYIDKIIHIDRGSHNAVAMQSAGILKGPTAPQPPMPPMPPGMIPKPVPVSQPHPTSTFQSTFGRGGDYPGTPPAQGIDQYGKLQNITPRGMQPGSVYNPKVPNIVQSVPRLPNIIPSHQANTAAQQIAKQATNYTVPAQVRTVIQPKDAIKYVPYGDLQKAAAYNARQNQYTQRVLSRDEARAKYGDLLKI